MGAVLKTTILHQQRMRNGSCVGDHNTTPTEEEKGVRVLRKTTPHQLSWSGGLRLAQVETLTLLVLLSFPVVPVWGNRLVVVTHQKHLTSDPSPK